jgi:O-antigen/teichoic acid export membrane protein
MVTAKKIVSGVKFSFVSTAVSQLSRGVLLLLLTRYLLDPSEYGLLYFALSIVMIVQVLSSIPKSGARYVTEYLESDEAVVPHVIRLTIGYVLVAAVALGAVLIVFNDVIARLVGESALAPLLVVGVGCVVFVPLYTSMLVICQAFNRMDWSAAISISESVARLLFATAFVLLGLDVLGALLGYVVSYATAAAIGSGFLYFGYYRDSPTSNERKSGLGREILSYSVPITGINVATVVDARVTTLLIGSMVGPTAVGFYMLAKQIVQFSIVPASALGFTISPALGEQRASDNVKSAAKIYEQSLTYVLLLFIPAGIGLVLVSRPAVVHVFGRDYLGAVPVLQVFSVFLVIRAVMNITDTSLDYLGEAYNRARAEIVVAFANVGLNLLLIPAMGVLGAAIATVLSQGLYTLVNVFFLHRTLEFDAYRVLHKTVLITGIGGAIALAVVLMRPMISGIVSLFAVVGVTGVIWFSLSVATGVINVRRMKAML